MTTGKGPNGNPYVRCRLIAVALIAGVVSTVCGETYTWTGEGAAGNWNDSANWDPSTGTPGAGDRAEFNTAGTYVITSDIALGEGTLTIKLGTAVTNKISGTISGVGGIRTEGSCTAAATLRDIITGTGSWMSYLVLSGDNSYSGGTTITNAFLRGDSTTAFGATDARVLFSGYTSVSLNAAGAWRSYCYTIGSTKSNVAIQFGEDLDWYGQLVSENVYANPTLYFLCKAKKTVNFRDSIDNAKLTAYMSVGTGSTKGQGLNFYAPIHVKSLASGGSPGNIGAFSQFHAQGNTYETMALGYTLNIHCMGERILDESRVLNWGGTYNQSTTGWFDLNGYNQQAKGLTSTATPETTGSMRDWNEIGCYLGDQTGSATTMYLVGATENCLFRGIVTNNLSVVWDPAGNYMQVFSNRVHGTTGRFVVSNGTMRVAGTATFKKLQEIVVAENASFECFSTTADCLAGLKRLVIEDGATFTVGDDTPKPFADGEIDLVVKGTGRIVMPAGMSVTMKTTLIKGIYVTGGAVAYDSSEDWIGGGEVYAGNANITSWKSATDGRWSDAANWTAGVPSGSQVAYITADGGDYTVTIDTDTVLNERNDIGNCGSGVARLSVESVAAMTNGYVNITDGGSLAVASTGSFLYGGKGDGTRTASSSTEVITIKGGEFRVDGGKVDFTGMSGQIVVGAGERGNGRIVMTDGSIYYLPDTVDDVLKITQGGFIDMSGGRFCFDYGTSGDPIAAFRLAGGEMCVTGGVFGVVHTNGTFGGVQMGPLHTNKSNLRFHSGKAVFGGNAVLSLNNVSRYEGKCYFSPATSGETLYFRMEGQAKTSPTDFRILYMGSLANDITVDMDWATTGMDNASSITYRSLIGFDRGGTFTFNLTNAAFAVDAVGTWIGMGYSNIQPTCPVHGILNVQKDGRLVIDGRAASNSGYTSWALCGLAVGYSCYTKVRSGKTMYQGELNIAKDGEVALLFGDVGIGMGFATGNVVVDGGTFNFNDHEKISGKNYNYIDRTLGIGLFGGEGTVTLKNGASFSSLPNVFVGGTVTNRFPIQGYNFFNYTTMPQDHSATGTLVVADADATLKQNLVLGMDGFGVVRREGSQGTFTAGNLVCTNIEDVAYTGSRLDFVFDANGVGSLDVTNAVSIFGNAKVNVDMSAYAGKKRNFKLIGCKARSGEFDEMTVTGVNLPNCTPVVEWTPKGLYLKMGVGMVMSFR